MDRDAGAESGSHRKAGRPPAGREHARAIVRRGQAAMSRNAWFRSSRAQARAASRFRAPRDLPPSKPRRRSARLSERRRARRAQAKEVCVCATGRPLTRARNAARLAASVAPTTGGDNFDIAIKARNRCVGVRRQPNDAPFDVHAFRPGRRRATAARSGAGQASVKPSPTSSTTSARTRASPGVVSMTPVSRRQSRSRNNAAECICSMTPPTRSASAMAALAPSISAPSPAMSG